MARFSSSPAPCSRPGCASIRSLLTGATRGFVVSDSWESDSGTIADLDAVDISEAIDVVASTGVLAGAGQNFSGYLPANAFTQDTHSTPVALMTGNSAQSTPVVVNVVPDPLTTVVGRVIDEAGAPQQDAEVTVLSRVSASASDGTFLIADVPTAQGDLIASAAVFLPDGTVLRGASAPAPPIAAGVTDVGDIVVRALVFEPDLGQQLTGCFLDCTDDCSFFLDLPFPFPFFGLEQPRMIANNNGNLVFELGDVGKGVGAGGFGGDEYLESIDQLVFGPPRIAPLWDDLIVGCEVVDALRGGAGAGIGGVPDADGDGVPDFADNCPCAFNPDQSDTDEDGIGDLCQKDGLDFDGDGIDDSADNCPCEFNPGQEDFDENGIGDVCEPPRDGGSGMYANLSFPDRIVVTWFGLLEYFLIPGPNTMQATLFADGRIQIAYAGISTLDGIVGLSPGGGPLAALGAGGGAGKPPPVAGAVDFSATAEFASAPGAPFFEQFEVAEPRGGTDPAGSGQNAERENPFDLDGGILLFTPNAAGGYDVRVIARGAGMLAPGAATISVTVRPTPAAPKKLLERARGLGQRGSKQRGALWRR